MPLRLRIISDSPELPKDQRLRDFPAVGGTIGRSADNDWILPDARRYVSSRHAMIDYQGGAYYLVDTSRNGVYVNGADTPVGRGHPQRLFDGDRLRIGEFEIAVEVTGSDQEVPEDGMRDSVVRAQLVPEDESIELMLVAEDKLTRDSVLQRHLEPAREATANVREFTRRPTTAIKAVAAADARGKAAPGQARARAAAAAKDEAPVDSGAPADGRGSSPAAALETFLAAAGLRPDMIAGTTTTEVLQLSGKLLRIMVSGVMELLRERSQVKDTFRLPQTVMQEAQNNPLKFSPSVDEALRYLLNDRSEGACLGAEDAVRATIRDVRQHEQAMLRAMLQAVDDYVERFDPEELRNRFDKGLKRGGLLSSANKLKYWDLYEESYPALVQRDDNGPPQLFIEEFTRAYMQEMDSARAARGRG